MSIIVISKTVLSNSPEHRIIISLIVPYYHVWLEIWNTLSILMLFAKHHYAFYVYIHSIFQNKWAKQLTRIRQDEHGILSFLSHPSSVRRGFFCIHSRNVGAYTIKMYEKSTKSYTQIFFHLIVRILCWLAIPSEHFYTFNFTLDSRKGLIRQ